MRAATFVFLACVLSPALLGAEAKSLRRSASAVAVRGEDCAGQARFNTIMCESHMCTMCVLEYCTQKCQEWQLKFPGCRCEDWAADRKSFSTGEFAGKGKFGDAGDFGR